MQKEKNRGTLICRDTIHLCGMFFIIYYGNSGSVFQTSGVLNKFDSGIVNSSFGTTTEIEIDNNSYAINWDYSGVGLYNIRDLKSVIGRLEGKKIDVKYWLEEKGIPIILELSWNGNEYISYNVAFSRLKIGKVLAYIMSYLFVAGGAFGILINLRVLRVSTKRERQKYYRYR